MSLANAVYAVLTAQTSISHGDPGVSGSGNVSPFRMQELLYKRPVPHQSPDDGETDEADTIGMEPAALRIRALQEAEAAIRDLARSYPLPVESALAVALQTLKAEEFVASAFVYSLISHLNRLDGGAGEGLFSGTDRYDMLLKRLAIVSSQFTTSFFTLYSSLLRELHIDSVLHGFTSLLWKYAALPRSVQQSTIATLGRDRQAVVTIARAWFDETRKERRAEGEDEQIGLFGSNREYYSPTGKVAGTSMEYAEAAVPHISSNAFRHSIFRETLCNHLLATLGLGSVEETVKSGLVPPYVMMLLSNGGNVKGGTKAPDYSNAVDLSMKRMFPSIELLGGCVPTHILSGSLSVANWTLCLQNNHLTSPYGYESDIDAATLLSIETHTRHTPDGMNNSKDAGQMLFSHTVMKPGARILLNFGFAPFTSRLAQGAAFFAFRSWLQAGGQIGGRENIGEGRLQLEDNRMQGMYLTDIDDLADAYEDYVESHADELRAALTLGTLGWKERLKEWA